MEIPHEFVEKNVGSWSEAHRGSGMAGIGFEGSIDLSSTFSQSLSGSCLKMLLQEFVEESEQGLWA